MGTLGEVADLHTQALRVGSDRSQRVVGRRKEDSVEDTLVLECQRAHRVRHREDDVKVSQRNQIAGSAGDPLVALLPLALGAVAVAAGVVGEAEILAASGAMVAMAAKRRRTAARDGAHDLQLRPCDMRLVALDETVAGCAKDVGRLQGGPVHDATGSRPSAASDSSVSSGFGAARNFRVDTSR